MTGKIPLKTAVILFLCCGIFIILSACMNPVDMEAFFKDPKVGDYIANTANKPANPTPPVDKDIVKVDDKTGDGLKGGKNVITNLKNNKYYMVEKATDADGNLVEDSYPKYVTDLIDMLGKGALYNELYYISKISGGSINGNKDGLNNSNTYTVRAAEPFQNGLIQYKDDGGSVLKQIKGGVLEIIGLKGTGEIDLSNILIDENYEAVALYADNSSQVWVWDDIKTSGWDSFKLEGSGSIIDYIFVNKDDLSDFKVLKVNIAAKDIVINLASIGGVTAPVTGATPVTKITDTTQYTGTVVWNGNPSTFDGGVVYTATITLAAKAGYTLTGVGADFFKVSGATANNAADSGVITAVFSATDITINIAAIGGVTAPVTGNTPVSAINETAQYTGAVTWSPAVSGTFAGEEVYTATITLTTKAGYTLAGVGANYFTVTGATANNAANSNVITAVFPPTDPTVINIAAIGGVTAPVTGNAPVSAINETAQYTGAVTWSPAVSGTFAGGQVYTATITLTAKKGYTLTGVGANYFTVTGATASNAANSGVITAVFPATSAPSNNVQFINISLTVPTLNPMDEPTFNVGSDVYIKRGDLSVLSSVTLLLNGTWDAGSIRWFINDYPDINAVLSANHLPVLTITNDAPYLSLLAGTGETEFTVNVYAESGGIPYSAKIKIPVKDY
jgi:hypothetical protein